MHRTHIDGSKIVPASTVALNIFVCQAFYYIWSQISEEAGPNKHLQGFKAIVVATCVQSILDLCCTYKTRNEQTVQVLVCVIVRTLCLVVGRA